MLMCGNNNCCRSVDAPDLCTLLSSGRAGNGLEFHINRNNLISNVKLYLFSPLLDFESANMCGEDIELLWPYRHAPAKHSRFSLSCIPDDADWHIVKCIRTLDDEPVCQN